ncbi:MAG TPA: IPTL-CTERM sorting domain-containing protein, partial [Acidimicrobiia bacterium]|nr:IPTL-CTERM sorting domain-containing protein [Acidimicrobiia bacterium]
MALVATASAAVALGPATAGAAATVFSSVGVGQSYAVPAGVTCLQVVVTGASGGKGSGAAVGGAPGQITATVPVASGETLTVDVGGVGHVGGVTPGAGGVNGGGAGASGSGGDNG